MKRNMNSFSSLTNLSESLRMELADSSETVGEVDLRGDTVKVPPAETVLGLSLRRMTSVTLSGYESSSSSLQSDSSWLDLESVKLEANTQQQATRKTTTKKTEVDKTSGTEPTPSSGSKPTTTTIPRTRRRHSTLTCSESNLDNTDGGHKRGIRPSLRLQSQWINSSRDVFNTSSSSDEGPSALQQFFADRQLVRETSRGSNSADATSSHNEGSTLPSAKDLTKMVKKDSLSQSRPVKRRGSFELLKETFMSSMQNLSDELDLQDLSQEVDC